MLVPSIDLYNGQAVQWRQGKERVLARDDVVELLDEFSLYGEVALIDLNAALGEGNNKTLIKQLLQRRRCRVGGGIRDIDTAHEYIKAGASKIILGTAAREDWVKRVPRDALIVAIDAIGDELVVKGWTEGSGNSVEDSIVELGSRCSELLYTQVLKEGMLQGMDRERISQVLARARVPVTVAGGITTLEDIRWLREQGANAQIGMAIYTGAFSLHDALLAAIDFSKQDLIPTIVQAAGSKEVLMLAYSNPVSLSAALQQRRGIYWSRSRKQLWRKGDESGNCQRLLRVDYDCDGDALLFSVEQTEAACHLQRRSCFPSQQDQYSLDNLAKVLRTRMTEADIADRPTYTQQLFRDEQLRAAKLREEANELIAANEYEHVRWEAADLIYFALVNAQAKGVGIGQIENELRARQR